MFRRESPQTKASAAVRSAAMDYVSVSGRARVEDYLTALSAVCGEAALLDANIGFNGEHVPDDWVPGAGVLGEAINVQLSGPSAEASPDSVYGVLASRLIPEAV